jgi:hypothetical protein
MAGDDIIYSRSGALVPSAERSRARVPPSLKTLSSETGNAAGA